jgi:hypothetical protein
MVFAIYATLLTRRNTTGPALFLQVFEARRVIRKLIIKVSDAVAQFFGYVLFDFHNEEILADYLRVVKGYLPVCLSECNFLCFGAARNIPIRGMKFAISCTEFSEATVVEASVFGFWYWEFGAAAGKDLRLQA